MNLKVGDKVIVIAGSNKGKEGTHGKFKTKKQADAQWYRSKKGRSSMKEYKEVESIFSELESHVVSSESLIERPYLDEYAFIEGKILERLDDGTEIELCLWTDRELQMSFWDVSIDKKIFDAEEDFLSYLKERGLYLEDIKDKYSRWHYCGLIPNDDVYRIQYYEEEDD